MNGIKKAILIGFAGLIVLSLMPVNTAEAKYTNKPLCYLIFWRDHSCEKNESSSPAPTPSPTPSQNQAPVWNGMQTAFNIKTGETLQFSVSAFDPDNNPLTYNASFLPSGASFNSQSKTFSWTPTSAQNGTYLIQFSVNDGNLYSFQSVSVNVNKNSTSTGANGNSKPILSSVGTKYVTTNQVLEFTIFASDADGDALEYTALNLPSGAIFDQASRTFSWIPTTSQIGNHVASFRVSDGKDYVDAGTIIYVTAPNNKPYFLNQPTTTAKVGQLYLFDLNAVDIDNNALIYNLATAPAGMTIHESTGVIQWTPALGQTGFNYVAAEVADGKGKTTLGFYIFVNDGSGAPVQNPTPGSPIRPQPVTSTKLKVSDIKIENDGGEILVSWSTNLPATARVIYDTDSQADKTKDFTYGNATPDIRTLSNNHRVNLEALETGTVYYLRVVSKTDDQLAVSSEVVFIQLEGGRINSLFGASLLDIIGPLFTNSGFLWLVILALGGALFYLYRKIQKVTSPL